MFNFVVVSIVLCFIAQFPLNFAQILNQHDNKYECFQFPESNPISSDGYELFGAKTTYFTAREILRKRYNTTLPLVDRLQCAPIYFHYLSRHAIRYPTQREMVDFDPRLIQLHRQLLESGNLSFEVANELSTWRLLWHRSQAEHISESGRFETSIQAGIFYRYFPTLLNLNMTDFEVGVTPKIRTTETAEAFVRSLTQFQVQNEQSTFDEANDSSSQIEKIIKDKFPMNEYDRVLFAFRRCKFPLPKQYLDLKATTPFQAMISEFAKRYNLESTTYETLWLVYQVCRYEKALFRHSPWCRLLTLNEMKMIQYSEDLREYHKSSGRINQIVCTYVHDLINRIQMIIKEAAVSKERRTKATLYFSHNEMFRLLSPFMNFYRVFPDYVHENDKICIPEEREYRGSNIIHFGTNFAVVLYRCNGDQQYKMLTLLNEIPIRIPGCSSELCEVEEFIQYYKDYPCDLDAICPLSD